MYYFFCDFRILLTHLCVGHAPLQELARLHHVNCSSRRGREYRAHNLTLSILPRSEGHCATPCAVPRDRDLLSIELKTFEKQSSSSGNMGAAEGGRE